jgi:uncharacterized membrane protein HdeD (DUF308 family)
MAEHTPVEIVRHASTLSILWGVLLIVFGILAVGSPFLAAVAVNVVIAWLIILAGVVHVILAFHAHRAGRLIWKLLVGLAYLFFGVYLIMHPVLGVVTLTLVLASLFLIEGILDIVLFFQMRSVRGSSWVLVDGIITLLLGLMIYLQWPSSAVWAIGILVGMSMIISGVTRVMLSLAVRAQGIAPHGIVATITCAISSTRSAEPSGLFVRPRAGSGRWRQCRGALQSCSAKSRSLTTTSSVGYR